MKSKVIIAVIVMGAAVGGFFAGRHFTAQSWSRSYQKYAYQRASNQAEQMVRALTYLRDGKLSEAADMMEVYLDSTLITFHVYGDKVQRAERADYVVRAARLSRDYRRIHPWTNSNQVFAESVEKVFQLAD